MHQAYDADRVRDVHLSHLLKHTSSPCLETFQDSFIEPSAYWCHAEKVSFFESLARHSRWKPDLIAEDIGGSKTIADVCSYISLLEQESAREPRKRCKRDAYPIAHELSEEWIVVENAAAHELRGKEAEWKEAALKHKRTQELREAKKSLRRGSESVRVCGVDDDNISTTSRNLKRNRQASDEENEVWEERFKARKRELRDLWKREDILSYLDGRYLNTMDKMVQMLESTETDKASDIGRDEHAQLRVPPSSIISHNVDILADQPSDLLSNVNEFESQIDPLLLATDSTFTNAQSLSSHLSDTHRDAVAPSSMGPQSGVSLPPQAHTPGSSRVEGSERVLRAQLLEIDPASQSPHPSPFPLDDLPSDLSPASRRRLRKRLWTRRKRAMESGVPVSEVSMDIAKLKRGRKARHKALTDAVKATVDTPNTQVEMNPPGVPDALPHPHTSQSHSRVEDDAEETEDEEKKLVVASKRKPYGWSKLMARQVSGETLSSDGVDLFHLEKFVSIMSLLGHVHSLSDEAHSMDEPEGSSGGPSTLSYPLLRLLRAYVTRFVTCLVAYAILHKDVETRQKRRIRSIFQTGGADEIRAENIHGALLYMDKDTTTKHFFKRLKHTVRKAAAVQAASGKEIGSEPRDTNDSEEPRPSDDGSSTEETEADMSAVRFNRVFQHIFPPPCDDPQSASPLLWNPNILTAFGGKEGDSLLPVEIDEAGLLKELRAEEKLEEADCKVAHMYEREMWMEIGVTPENCDLVTTVGSKQKDSVSQEPAGTEVSTRHLNAEDGQSHSHRFRQPGGTVKSMVYIDSDEDL